MKKNRILAAVLLASGLLRYQRRAHYQGANRHCSYLCKKRNKADVLLRL